MIRRALRLRTSVQSYLTDESTRGIQHFRLSSREWRQLNYLRELLAPFYAMTNFLSNQQGPSVQSVLKVYNTLFDLIDTGLETLSRKQVSWKVAMRHGLEAARTKLSKYYSRTYKAQGDIFAIATILDPASKLQYFKGEEWDDDGEVDWYARYRGIFTRVFMHYMDQNPSIQVDKMAADYDDKFETYMQHVTKKRRLTAPKPATSGYREVETYLNEGMFPL